MSQTKACTHKHRETRAHARTHTHTDTNKHAHTHTHTHINTPKHTKRGRINMGVIRIAGTQPYHVTDTRLAHRPLTTH